MARHVLSKPTRLAALVLLTAIGLLALLLVPGWRPRDILARQWRKELATVPDDQALARLRNVAGLGDVGIPILVEALGNERESVAQAAQEVLVERVDRWQLLRARYSSPKIAMLASSLAEWTPRFGPASRRVASDLALKMLLWPVDGKVTDGGQLIVDCELVLRAHTDSRPPVRSEFSTRGSSGEGRSTGDLSPAVALGNRHAAGRIALDELSVLPGGGLPTEPMELPALPPSLVNQPRPDDFDDDSPRLFEPSWEGGLSSTGGQPKRLNPPMARRIPREPQPAQDPASHPSSVKPLSANQRADLSEPGSESLAELSDVEVMRYLHAAGQQLTGAAHRELAGRGFDSVRLKLAHDLTDPDPRTRKALADALPGIRGIDARPWLLWLSHDEDPEVRLVAITVMATTTDRRLLERLRQLELHETDPNVLRQLQRMQTRRRP